MIMKRSSNVSVSFRPRSLFAALGIVLAAGLPASAAVTWNDIQFGGFASQGFLINTGDNDYLGNTSDGTFDFREYAANASWSKGKFRVGAQAFGQKLGEYGEDKIKLDWAIVDYQATQWFGIRAGRVKMPRGLYNEALDVDAVRPFVLLPQSVYDARLRDFNASFDGAMLYGNIGLGRLGSLDYRIFYGAKKMPLDSGAADYFNNDVPWPNTAIDIDGIRGGALFWNTPLNGLKVGYSYNGFEKFRVERNMYLETMPGMPPVPTPVFKESALYERQILSAEYVTGDWQFAIEAGREQAYWQTLFAPMRSVNYAAYASAARRVNSWLELGGYVSYSKDSMVMFMEPRVDFPEYRQFDYALSARFDLNEYTIFKLEAHYFDGAGKLFSTVEKPIPEGTADESWAMIAAKVTFSF